MVDTPQGLSPEEVEQLRAYGTALLGTAMETPRQDAWNAVHPLSAFVRPLQAAQGRSTLNMVERTRAGQRQELFSPSPSVTGAPGVIRASVAASFGSPTASVSLATGSGLHPRYVDTLIGIESSGDPEAVTGSFRGLGMFSRDLEQRYGITDWTNPDQQRQAITRHAQHLGSVFRRRFNREATPGELYLLHQQGEGGGPTLLDPANAGRTAFEVLMPLYGNNSVTTQSAIQRNLPRQLRSQWRTITAGEFANVWTNRFDQRLSRAPVTGSTPVTAPVGGAPVTPGARVVPPVTPSPQHS